MNPGRKWKQGHNRTVGTVGEHFQVLPNGCRVFTKTTNGVGYGRARIAGLKEQVYLHRWFWEQEHGPIPNGIIIHHTCSTRNCCETRHMELMTLEDHGRLHARIRTKEQIPRGSQSGTSKLTEAIVAKARIRRSAGEIARYLAEEYGVSRQTMQMALTGRTWTHVGGPIQPRRALNQKQRSI